MQNKEQVYENRAFRSAVQTWQSTGYGFEDKSDESWEESETRVRNYIDEHLNIDEASIQIERALRIRCKNSPRPIIAKFSHYKDRENVLKCIAKNAKTSWLRLQITLQRKMYGRIYVCEYFLERVIRVRSKLCASLKSSIEEGRTSYLKYDRLMFDGQEYTSYMYDYDNVQHALARK